MDSDALKTFLTVHYGVAAYRMRRCALHRSQPAISRRIAFARTASLEFPCSSGWRAATG